MRRAALLLLLATPAIALERPAAPPLRPVEFYCTDREGHLVELGQMRCIQAGCDPAYLARCDMSLNNVMWRKVQEGCPGAVLRAPPATPRSASG